MEFTFTLAFNLAWWQYLLIALGVVYAGLVLFAMIKGAPFKLAVFWPILLLIGGVNVQ